MTTAPQPNVDFRPDPDRGVYLSGPITQETLDRITPTVLKLHASSRRPITLFIDSPGGETRAADTLNKLLGQVVKLSVVLPPDHSRHSHCSERSCRSSSERQLRSCISSLENLMSRSPSRGRRLTREEAILLARGLASSNEGFALELARNCIFRFIFRFVLLLQEFASIRERENNTSLSDSYCMTLALQDRVSGGLRGLLWDSFNQSVEIETRDEYVAEKLEAHDIGNNLPPAEFAVLVLKAILDYELKLLKEKNYPPWSLVHRFGEIEEKLLLLIDKHGDHHTAMIRTLCERWGEFFLTPTEEAEFESKDENDRVDWLFSTVQKRLWPIWSFFVSLCRQLQKEDHWLSAEEAYWLGLIDEVIGRNDLSNLRLLSENAPQNPA